MQTKISIKPYGQSAVLLEWTQEVSEELLREICHWEKQLKLKIKGVSECVPGFASLLVFFDFDEIKLEDIAFEIENEIRNEIKIEKIKKPTTRVPICFDFGFSLDLAELAERKNKKKESIIAQYLSKKYRVHLFGFLPGFVYLGGLDKDLVISRKITPRARVPKGSIAIGGQQTGIYPSESPGGWQIIGRTPIELFDLSKQNPSPFEVGGEVQFYAVNKDKFNFIKNKNCIKNEKKRKEIIVPEGKSKIKILRAGIQASIQDQGRKGYRHLGVPLAGPMDARSADLANLLLGNTPDCPLLEMALSGPVLKFEAATCIVLTGADLPAVLNGQPIYRNQVMQVQAGDLLEIGRAKTGFRAYLAVKNGFYAPKVLGSVSYCSTAPFGLSALVKGDSLYYDHYATRQMPNAKVAVADLPLVPKIRLLPGPEFLLLSQQYLGVFFEAIFTLAPTSNRMALGLVMEAKEAAIPCPIGKIASMDKKGTPMLSSPVMPGTIQLPPSGQPILLVQDCQTVGGYPRIFQVVEEDMWLLGQCGPGASIQFELVGLT